MTKQDIMQKTIIGIVLFFTVLVAGCIQAENIDDESQSKTTPAETLADAQANVKEFTVTAKQWEFTQDEIRVKKGDLVRITLNTLDVAHGFALSEYGISERLDPGDEVTVEFIADKEGEFDFFCNMPCGEGHPTMRGMLVVE